MEASATLRSPSLDPHPSSRYGRARLWLGISGVGTLVVLAILALSLDLPGSLAAGVGSGLGEQGRLFLFGALAYAAVQLPFDLFGGYLLPRWHGRAYPSLLRFLVGLGRGVVVQGALLWSIAMTLLLASRIAGAAGLVVGGILLGYILLAIRGGLARLLADRFEDQAEPGARGTGIGGIPTSYVGSADEGYTGGFLGVLRPTRLQLPRRWKEQLRPVVLELVRRRRLLAVETGAWRRGRWAALAFTWLGLLLAAWLVPAERLGMASGVMGFSLWFTLWSFLGLLVLPKLTQAGVAAVDAQLRAEGADPSLIEESIRCLDGLQDDEARRPPFVEAIFHPIPSVERRLAGIPSRLPACWDTARTAIYLSAAGLGLLGRAVHCNSGRPALWAQLPLE